MEQTDEDLIRNYLESFLLEAAGLDYRGCRIAVHSVAITTAAEVKYTVQGQRVPRLAILPMQRFEAWKATVTNNRGQGDGPSS